MSKYEKHLAEICEVLFYIFRTVTDSVHSISSFWSMTFSLLSLPKWSQLVVTNGAGRTVLHTYRNTKPLNSILRAFLRCMGILSKSTKQLKYGGKDKATATKEARRYERECQPSITLQYIRQERMHC